MTSKYVINLSTNSDLKVCDFSMYCRAGHLKACDLSIYSWSSQSLWLVHLQMVISKSVTYLSTVGHPKDLTQNLAYSRSPKILGPIFLSRSPHIMWLIFFLYLPSIYTVLKNSLICDKYYEMKLGQTPICRKFSFFIRSIFRQFSTCFFSAIYVELETPRLETGALDHSATPVYWD